MVFRNYISHRIVVAERCLGWISFHPMEVAQFGNPPSRIGNHLTAFLFDTSAPTREMQFPFGLAMTEEFPEKIDRSLAIPNEMNKLQCRPDLAIDVYSTMP